MEKSLSACIDDQAALGYVEKFLSDLTDVKVLSIESQSYPALNQLVEHIEFIFPAGKFRVSIEHHFDAKNILEKYNRV